jgi:hypothetical protein
MFFVKPIINEKKGGQWEWFFFYGYSAKSAFVKTAERSML